MIKLKSSSNYFVNVSSDGTYINERHVKILVDIMTHHGTISSVSRYGMKKDNTGPIAKASFEQSLDNFINDLLAGVSCGVIMNYTNLQIGISISNIGSAGYIYGASFYFK